MEDQSTLYQILVGDLRPATVSDHLLIGIVVWGNKSRRGHHELSEESQLFHLNLFLLLFLLILLES